MQYRKVAAIGMAKLKMSRCLSSLQSLAFFSERALSFYFGPVSFLDFSKRISANTYAAQIYYSFFLNRLATFPKIMHHFLKNYKNKK